MNHFEKLDAFFMTEEQEVTKLEQAARLCSLRAINAKTIWAAMLAQSCAIDIRSMPEWSVYKPNYLPHSIIIMKRHKKKKASHDE